jgi:hypothetical protein
MKYTKWVEANLPAFQGKSSVEKYDLIQNAKKSTSVIRLSIKIFIYITALMALGLLEIPFPPEGATNWTLVVVAFIFAEIISYPIEFSIITNRLKRLEGAA